MRLFAGVELPPDVQVACATAARAVASRLDEDGVRTAIRWTPEQNLHVTLWFFGEVDGPGQGRIAAAMSAPSGVPAFPAVIGGGGVFPLSGPARILWLGLQRGAESFAALYRELGARVAPLGFPAERRAYHPHVTVGRVRETTRESARVRAVLRGITTTPHTFDVRSITLFHSRLSPRGSAYEPLLRVPLS